MHFTLNRIYNAFLDKIRQEELGGVILHKKGYDEHEKNHGISRQLSGKRNKRLHSHVRVGNNYTAAWADQHVIYPETNVTAPSEEMTEEAKDWVDNGSKL